ncbi:MAG: hypothetical protein GQ574_11365 [Crocinitomix sp.]|nr:hypothetical protein [Crocinitomix sp.]
MESQGLLGIINCFGGAGSYESVMNLIETSTFLLPALLLVVLFIRMKVLAGRDSLVCSYAPTDILMQEQKADHKYNGQLPFANFNFSRKKFLIFLALLFGFLVIYFD